MRAVVIRLNDEAGLMDGASLMDEASFSFFKMRVIFLLINHYVINVSLHVPSQLGSKHLSDHSHVWCVQLIRYRCFVRYTLSLMSIINA